MALTNLSIAQYVIDLAEKLEDIHGVQMCDTIEQWNKITGMKICEDADLSKLGDADLIGDDYKGGRINKFVVELGPHNKIKYVAQPAEKPAAKSAEKKKVAPAKTAKKSAKTQVKEKLLNSLVREAQEIIGSNRIRGSASTFDEMEVVMNKLDAIQEVVIPDDETEKIINDIYCIIYCIISDRMRNDDGEFSDPINYYDYDEMMDEMMSLIGYD
jgi:hypothetical protein